MLIPSMDGSVPAPNASITAAPEIGEPAAEGRALVATAAAHSVAGARTRTRAPRPDRFLRSHADNHGRGARRRLDSLAREQIAAVDQHVRLVVQRQGVELLVVDLKGDMVNLLREHMPETARILTQPGRTLVMTCSEDEAARERLEKAGAEVVSMPFCSEVVDLPAVLDKLGQLEINEVLLETGANLSGTMLQAGLIDELVIYMAPVLMGDQARGLFRLPGLDSMADKIALHIEEIRAVGQDWRIRAKVTRD